MRLSRQNFLLSQQWNANILPESVLVLIRMFCTDKLLEKGSLFSDLALRQGSFILAGKLVNISYFLISADMFPSNQGQVIPDAIIWLGWWDYFQYP